MPFASQPYKTPYCNRHCQPLLRCPSGSHISATRQSCVWHGRDGSASRGSSSPGGLLSSILGTSSAPSTDSYGPSSSRYSLPSRGVYDSGVNPARSSALADYMADRSGSEEFGGGARRRRRSRSRSSSGRRRRHSSGRRRRRSKSKSHRRRRKSTGRRRRH